MNLQELTDKYVGEFGKKFRYVGEPIKIEKYERLDRTQADYIQDFLIHALEKTARGAFEAGEAAEHTLGNPRKQFFGEDKPQMHKQWKCEQCHFPENFTNNCAMCGVNKPQEKESQPTDKG
ncbi:MAG TPA: hypothetical protein ENI13_00875 [candidate division CPR3 bacterium]|uniref:Uncharacterized protein n=1 Tax=candidate division CPR3 bacterium TaxID=2268181 RepID=A0A7C1NMC8_UNCC3|nr:hypothetical protein [candidate division CPR3 bacterium]